MTVPDRDWPPGPRRLARLVRVCLYALAAVAGLFVVTAPGGSVLDRYGSAWVRVLAVMALVGGAVAAVGALTHLWQVEWVALWLPAAAFAGYAALDLTVGEPAQGAGLAVGALGMIARGIDLLVFSVDARRARLARRRAATWNVS